MWFADLVTPVASSNGNDGQLGQDDGSADSSGYLFGALHSQTNVAIVVTDSNEGLKISVEPVKKCSKIATLVFKKQTQVITLNLVR